jgi:hypothetical protein
MNLVDALAVVVVAVLIGLSARHAFKRGKKGEWQYSRLDLLFMIGFSALANLAFWFVVMPRIPENQQDWFVRISVVLINVSLLSDLRFAAWQFGKNTQSTT